MQHAPQLLKVPYTSMLDREKHHFLLYLPCGYTSNNGRRWPVILFLHGNGERGNGRNELDYVLCHGPLYESWIQKRDLPFIIIAPQLPMFDMHRTGDLHLQTRTPEMIPRRLMEGVTPRAPRSAANGLMDCRPALTDLANVPSLLPDGWEQVETDVIRILQQVLQNYRTDAARIYLTGISYGGFGSWYLASRFPRQFTAIAPIAGWGHPELMPSIAQHNLPLWAFAGGRDEVIPLQYFYAGLNCLESLGHTYVRFTIHADMGHDVWRRVYAGEDLFSWFLQYQRPVNKVH